MMCKKEVSATSQTALTDAVSRALDSALTGDDMAQDAAYSRGHFQRVFRDRLGETPGDCRRRLLLERAAHQLRYAVDSVTNIALSSGFDSLEGFSRAFKKAFGMSPSHFRRLDAPDWLLPSTTLIHYNPIIGAAIQVRNNMQQPLRQIHQAGEIGMDLIDRMIEHDIWLTRKMLDAAAQLTDAQLDAPLSAPQQPLSFEPPDDTLRVLLHRLVFGKEAWMSGIHGRALADPPVLSVAGLRARHEAVAPEWLALVRKIKADGRMDDHFVDLGCDPPETFSYGGMIAHVITVSAQRRGMALAALRGHGATALGYGDPIEYDCAERIEL
jgi:AraC family transcriptional regulator